MRPIIATDTGENGYITGIAADELGFPVPLQRGIRIRVLLHENRIEGVGAFRCNGVLAPILKASNGEPMKVSYSAKQPYIDFDFSDVVDGGNWFAAPVITGNNTSFAADDGPD